ncbi:MAG: MerR family transcriptional regulator [Hyphomicrobiaceae bacterium]
MITATLASRSQLAKELGISPGTFARYEQAGLLPKPLHGTRRYVREAVLEALRPKAATASKLSAFERWERGRDGR